MTKTEMAALRRRIRRARTVAGLSIPELATKIGVVHTTVMRWEGDGPSQPRAGDLVDIARACGCSAAWLLTGDGASPVATAVGL